MPTDHTHQNFINQQDIMYNLQRLPDIASQASSQLELTLQWVGMEAIALPIEVTLAQGVQQNISAKADIFVSLNKTDAKGIHMSRLHLALNKQLAHKALSKDSLHELLRYMVDSQQGLSENARLQLTFEITLDKPALLSDESGFQSYPVVLTAELNQGRFTHQLQLTVPYSSTCPCSAALSRKAYSDVIKERFVGEKIDRETLLSWLESEAGSIATPHSQRSYAYLTLDFAESEFASLELLIQELEFTLATAVQTAVKREDEQAFAKLNAKNLMFCEDSARRIKAMLERKPEIYDYWFKVEHQESLHAHNAVVIDRKINETSQLKP